MRPTAMVGLLHQAFAGGRLMAQLDDVRNAARDCRNCDLYRDATQTVFGMGSASARIMLVGEQPGDQEDRRGQPFVGPAGRLLERALAEAGLAPGELYLTNAVEHFRWRASGKRRLHVKPDARHIRACRPWLIAELDAIEPEILVLLGVTAGHSVFGKAMTISALRGRVLPSPLHDRTIVTVHPSSILRIPDQATRDAAFHIFASDLRLARRAPDDRPSPFVDSRGQSGLY